MSIPRLRLRLEPLSQWEILAQRIESLSDSMLFGFEGDEELKGIEDATDELQPIATAHYLKAKALLDQAEQEMMLCHHTQMRDE